MLLAAFSSTSIQLCWYKKELPPSVLHTLFLHTFHLLFFPRLLRPLSSTTILGRGSIKAPEIHPSNQIAPRTCCCAFNYPPSGLSLPTAPGIWSYSWYFQTFTEIGPARAAGIMQLSHLSSDMLISPTSCAMLRIIHAPSLHHAVILLVVKHVIVISQSVSCLIFLDRGKHISIVLRSGGPRHANSQGEIPSGP